MRILSRICLGCGYDGPEIQRGDASGVFVCPCCAEDLYARPPRSYAEMEGLLGHPCQTWCERAVGATAERTSQAPVRGRRWWRRTLAWLGLDL